MCRLQAPRDNEVAVLLSTAKKDLARAIRELAAGLYGLHSWRDSTHRFVLAASLETPAAVAEALAKDVATQLEGLRTLLIMQPPEPTCYPGSMFICLSDIAALLAPRAAAVSVALVASQAAHQQVLKDCKGLATLTKPPGGSFVQGGGGSAPSIAWGAGAGGSVAGGAASQAPSRPLGPHERGPNWQRNRETRDARNTKRNQTPSYAGGGRLDRDPSRPAPYRG